MAKVEKTEPSLLFPHQFEVQGSKFKVPNTQHPRMLAGIYGWFSEGFDTADLQEARVLKMVIPPAV